ncbi:MAG: hypothetical protein NTX42_00235 [Methanothrix sp.]|nr:hypothetical protein [Methanothrix sp.]
MAIDWNQVSSTITAIATVGLAIYAYKSFKGVKDQMDLVYKQSVDMKRQADAMEIQSKFIRNQSDAMAKQADIMDSQTDFVRDQSFAIQNQAKTMLEQAEAMKSQSDSMKKQSNLMLENMEYDRLVKKYERVNREMVKLVGPLFERKNDINIFSLKYKRSVRIVVSPTSRVPDPSPNTLIYDFVSFWDSIEQNMYLNRSSEFQTVFSSYSVYVRDYFQKAESGADEKRKQDLEDIFNRNRKPEFIREIEIRHLELSTELKDIESQLSMKISEEKKVL